VSTARRSLTSAFTAFGKSQLRLFGYVTVQPILARVCGAEVRWVAGVHGPQVAPLLAPPKAPRRLAVAVDFSTADAAVLSYAVTMARTRCGRGARVLLPHVVESGGARVFPGEVSDAETRSDEERLAMYADELSQSRGGGDLRPRLRRPAGGPRSVSGRSPVRRAGLVGSP
jgi:hypothetical protein